MGHAVTAGEKLQSINPATGALLRGLQAKLFSQGVDMVTAHHKAIGMLYRGVQQQAALMAYMDNFRLMAFLALICAPLLLFFQKVKKHD